MLHMAIGCIFRISHNLLSHAIFINSSLKSYARRIAGNCFIILCINGTNPLFFISTRANVKHNYKNMSI